MPDNSTTSLPTTASVACAHSEVWPLEKFVPHPRNPNRHPAEQLRILGKIILAQGWRSPVCVSRRSGLVIKGHGRLAAAKLVGLTTAPVDVQDYADETSELADLVADNRLSELAEISMPDLKTLLAGFEPGALDMELAGFDEMELARVLKSFDVKGENDTEKVWAGMPACDADNQLAICLTVRFKTVEEKIAFGKIVGQSITAISKSVWFPKWKPDQLGTKEGVAYVES